MQRINSGVSRVAAIWCAHSAGGDSEDRNSHSSLSVPICGSEENGLKYSLKAAHNPED